MLNNIKRLFRKTPDPVRVSYLASGRGSNFRAVAEKIRSGVISGAVNAALVCDNPEAGAIAIARELGIPVEIAPWAEFRGNRAGFDRQIRDALLRHNSGLVVAAGFMKIMGPDIIRAFPNRIINIHPALLPSFPGLHAQRQAWEYGVKITGCTAHFVDEGVDSGPVILQEAVNITSGMTLEQLEAAIRQAEHRVLPAAVGLFCAGRLAVTGRTVRIAP